MSNKKHACSSDIELARSVHKIKLTQRNPDRLLTGANTIVTLDGKELFGATSIKIEVDAKSIGKVTIEMYAAVEVDEAIVKDAEIKVDNSIILRKDSHDKE